MEADSNATSTRQGPCASLCARKKQTTSSSLKQNQRSKGAWLFHYTDCRPLSSEPCIVDYEKLYIVCRFNITDINLDYQPIQSVEPCWTMLNLDSDDSVKPHWSHVGACCAACSRHFTALHSGVRQRSCHHSNWFESASSGIWKTTKNDDWIPIPCLWHPTTETRCLFL